MKFDGRAFSEEVVALTRSFVERSLAPLVARLEAAEKALAAIPAPAAPVDVPAIVADALEAMTGMIDAAVKEAAAALPAPPTAEEVAALVPVPQDGKNGSDGAPGATGVDGASVDPETVKAMVDEAVADMKETVNAAVLSDLTAAAETVAHDMKAEIGALPKIPTAEEVVALIPPPAPGKDASLEDIAAAVEKALETWDRPKDGKDGESVTLDQIQPVIETTVEKALEARPVPQDGKDGVGLAGAIKDHEGALVLTLTDGTMVKLGKVDGASGKDGLDGLGFDDLEVVDDPTTFTLRLQRGDHVKEWTLAKPTLADMHKGVWKEGGYPRGTVVTWGGSLWLAKADTEAKPETDDTWTLVTKRGRDGKDGEAPKAPPVVKLK